MSVSFALIVVLSGVCLVFSDHQENVTCPTWMTYNPSTNSCDCESNVFHTVHCNHRKGYQVAVLYGFCMTLNKDQTKAVVGACPFHLKETFLTVPSHPSQLEEVVCGHLHRTGQLCGQCKNGTSPPVYSYYPQCVNCPAGTNNWPKYLVASLLPTTLFFLAALLLRFRLTSSHMNGYILFCQILTSPPMLRHVQETWYLRHYEHNFIKIFGDFYISYLSIWNLDFFRMVYSPFCLQSNASTLQILSLDYIIAAYPLALIFLTYKLVTLHYYNCRLVVWFWRPFLRCCIRFQRQFDIQNSLVDAFATFLLLSYVKFLSVSCDILTPTMLWDAKKVRQPTVLYYDGTIEYFSNEHLPYALLAMIALLVFTLLPILLLCLYPCHCFQRFLNSCHLRRQSLHMFMEVFQGCYKDGTNGTRDCRYFAALYLIIRVVVHLSLVFLSFSFINSVLNALLAIMILLLFGFHPYKKKFSNHLILDIFFILSIGLCASSAFIQRDYSNHLKEVIDRVIVSIIVLISVVCPLCYLLYHIWKKSRSIQSATWWIRVFLTRPATYQQFEESLVP